MTATDVAGRTGPDPAATRRQRRMTLAVPNKGRLVEPTLALLHDAGLVFEERDRSLVSHVENVPLDILFVRTNDVIEFVGDGVADLGITGGDLLAEAASDLPIVRSLGYGRCRLAAAVPRDAPQRDIAELAGLRVATAHPEATRRWFEQRGIPVVVIPSPARSRSHPAWGWPTRSSTWSRPAPRSARTACDPSATCSPRRRSWSATLPGWWTMPRPSIASIRCSGPCSPVVDGST